MASSPCDQAQPASSAMPRPPPQLRNTRTRLRLSAARVYGIRGRAARQGAPRSAAARRSAPRNWVLGTGLRSCARSSSPGPGPAHTLRCGSPALSHRCGELAALATRTGLSFPPVATLATASMDSDLDAPAACLTAPRRGLSNLRSRVALLADKKTELPRWWVSRCSALPLPAFSVIGSCGYPNPK